MTKDREFTATFLGARRAGCSVNGNPTWELRTSEGKFRTQSDSSLGYEVSNHTHSRFGLIGQECVFTATRAGRVYDMRRAR